MLWQCDAEDGVLVFADAGTCLRGTLLGLLETTASSYAGTPTGTGDRVTELTALPGRSLLPGTYTALAGTLSSGAGPVTVTAPDGRKETVTVTASGDQAFPILGININIAASGTTYVTADSIAFAVSGATTRRWTPYVATGVNGAQRVNAVLVDEVVATEAASIPIRPVVGGEVNKNLLVIHADGHGNNITIAHIEQMRVSGIVAKSTHELGGYDNQPA